MDFDRVPDQSKTPDIRGTKRWGRDNPISQSTQNLQNAGQAIAGGPPSGYMKPYDMRVQDQANQKLSYAEELKKQMNEQQNKKLYDKQQDRVQDMEYMNDYYNYNPFGKSGGGAPLKDQFGNVIAVRMPQFKNEFQRMHGFRKSDISQATKAVTRHGYRNGLQTAKPFSRAAGALDGGSLGDQQQPEADFYFTGNPNRNTSFGQRPTQNTNIDLSQNAALGIQNPDFQPDYIVSYQRPEPKQEEKQANYIVQEPQPEPKQVVYDYSTWLTELLNLLYYERLTREDEDRRRRENQMLEEERLRREKEELDLRYRRELADRQKSYEKLQEENLNKLEDFWERLHNEEADKWETLMKTRPVVQYVERDDTLKLSQALVDHLQNAIRTELDKVKANIDMQEVDVTAQINSLKRENFDIDKERMSTLIELDQINKVLDDARKMDDMRSKYVYQTLLWDKMLDNALFKGKSIKDMPELIDAKTRYLKPTQRDKYRLADEMEVPDRKCDIPTGGINVDKINAWRLNEKNSNRLGKLNYYEETIRKPEYELDFLDKEINRAYKKYDDAVLPPSRYGGLQIGEHQKNYDNLGIKF